jgi:outer membrane protein assembly factor BamB
MRPLAADDPRMVGEFRLYARLGSGGMGRVFLAYSPGGRAVAVKVVHPHLARDAAFLSRFRREVAAALAVNGSYAAPVVAAGPDDDPPWLATAYVSGPSLQEVVTATGPLPEDAVLKLAAGLAEALRVIHGCGLVHRDLKPGNVLLAADGPRVIDFGIARALDGTVLTSAESVLGTPSFMSPEQAQGQPTGPASDVFSLGGVVYFAATGANPFGTGHPAVMLYRIVHTEPDLHVLPPRLWELAAACLARDPARRPAPAQLATALTGTVPPGDSPATFWPTPVARLIRDYQARLGAGPLASGPWTPGPPTAPPTPATPTTIDLVGHRPPGRVPEPIPGMGRRRALAALAGMAVGGLAVAGWELTRPGPPGVSGNLAGQRGPARPLPAPGGKVWSFEANSSVDWLVASRGVVYVGTGEDTVFALDAATGKPVWHRATVTAENSQLVVAGDALVIADPSHGGVLGLDAATGQQLWDIGSTGGGGVLGLAAAGDVVYAGYAARSTTDGGVTALSAGTGDLLWTSQFGVSDTNVGLAAADGVVYATTYDGQIYAFKAANGNTLWRDSGRGATFGSTPVVAGGVVYLSSSNNPPVLYAVRAAKGEKLWQRSLGSASFAASLAAARGLVFAGLTPDGRSSGLGDLSAWNADTGHRVWRAQVTGGVFPVTPGAANVVYSGSNNGVLDAWRAEDGAHLWSYSATDAIASNIVVADGIVYFGSNDHHAYAVAAQS